MDLTPLQEILLYSDDLDDEEILSLLSSEEESMSTYNPEWPRVDIDQFTRKQAFGHFRFDQEDIRVLTLSLGLPNKIILPSRNVISGEEGMAMILKRFAYPNRLFELEEFFGLPKSVLSLGINWVVDFIYENHHQRLTRLDQPWIINRLQTYADAVHAKGAPLQNCIGFVDGTVRPICRPTRYQRVCFNGHKRIHSLKFQAVVVPDGMIMNLFGPVEGRRHYCALLTMSGLLTGLEQIQQRDRNGVVYALYGDPAYPLRNSLIAPYRGGDLTDMQSLFNKRMSSVRECVEWEFGNVLRQFAFLDYRKNLKILLQPVGKYYAVGALLANCMTCIYGSQSGTYFGLDAPGLDEYLRHVQV